MCISTETVLHTNILSCWLDSVEYFILNQNLKLWYTVWITKEHVFTFFLNIFLSTKKLTAYVILFQVFFLISSHVRYILEFWYKSHITGYGWEWCKKGIYTKSGNFCYFAGMTMSVYQISFKYILQCVWASKHNHKPILGSDS